MILGCGWARPDRTGAITLRFAASSTCRDTRLLQPHGRPLPGGRPARDLTSPLPAFPGSHLGWEERGSRATHTLSPAKLRDCEVD